MVKIKEKKITLKDLIVSFEKETFHECFGIKLKRGDIILEQLDKIIKRIQKKSTWKPAELLKEVTKKEVAHNFRETAFVVFIIGCYIGEDTAYQNLLSHASLVSQVIERRKREGEYYEN
jgi:hypothetical protein